MSEQKPTYLIGLDLGQAADYTALTIVERHKMPVGEPELRDGKPYQKTEPHFHLRYVERFPLGTPYPDVVERVRHVTEELKKTASGRLSLVVDKTGVGAPVVDMLKEAKLGVRLVSVTITGGAEVHEDGLQFTVPKRDLASTLQVLLQSGRLKFAARLPFRDVLERELQNFKVKINVSTGHDSYEAWREGDHDDLVLALALAVWYGANKRGRPGPHMVTSAVPRPALALARAFLGGASWRGLEGF